MIADYLHLTGQQTTIVQDEEPKRKDLYMDTGTTRLILMLSGLEDRRFAVTGL
jgi:hypothetical protein